MKNFIWKLIGVWCFMCVLGNAYSQKEQISIADKTCEGETVKFTLLLDPSIPTTSLTTSIQWNFGDGSRIENSTVTDVTSAVATHVYTKGNTYSAVLTVTYTGAYPQSFPTKTVLVNLGPSASFDFGRYEGACKGGSVILPVNTYGKNYVLWSTGQTFDGSAGVVKYNVTTAGLYKAIVYDVNLCQTPLDGQNTEDKGVTTVSFFDYPEIESLEQVQLGDAVQIVLTPKSNPYSEAIKYEWSTPNGGTVTDLGANKYQVTQPGVYNVTATQVHKFAQYDATCVTTKSITIKKVLDAGNESSAFDAYNTFIPTSTGKSATWTLKTPENIVWYQKCKLTIYNSWGQVVYTKEPIGTSTEIWNGKTNGGKDLPSDTYYYIVKCSNCNCEPAPNNNTHTGSVTIIRK